MCVIFDISHWTSSLCVLCTVARNVDMVQQAESVCRGCVWDVEGVRCGSVQRGDMWMLPHKLVRRIRLPRRPSCWFAWQTNAEGWVPASVGALCKGRIHTSIHLQRQTLQRISGGTGSVCMQVACRVKCAKGARQFSAIKWGSCIRTITSSVNGAHWLKTQHMLNNKYNVTRNTPWTNLNNNTQWSNKLQPHITQTMSPC
jgi:hypothetical protein